MTEQPRDPIARFREVFQRARDAQVFDATAGTLATVDANGQPHARVVLLKDFDEHGFVIYTNRDSNKGKELRSNPRASLCFFWPYVGEQVRVEGPVELVSDEESDAYFASRPRGSQIGAWASLQSQPLSSREELLRRVDEITSRYEGHEVPRPPYWGGYRILPERIEFWINGEDRLHDRFLYTLDRDAWTVQRLFP